MDNLSTLKPSGGLGELSPRHEYFCQRVALHGNVALAAREAGYSSESSGYRIMRKARIKARIAQLQDAAAAEAGVTLDRVVLEWARIGFANMADYVNRAGVLDVARLTRDKASAVVEFAETTSAAGVVTRRIKLANKLAALDSLGRHLGAYEADNQQQRAESDAIDARDLARRVAFLLRDAAETGRDLPGEFVDLTPESAKQAPN